MNRFERFRFNDHATRAELRAEAEWVNRRRIFLRRYWPISLRWALRAFRQSAPKQEKTNG